MKYILVLFILVFYTNCSNPQQEITESKTQVKVSTKLGEMVFDLHDETPKHKAMFLDLAEQSHFNQFSFNRVIKDFVIQGGCPDSIKYFKDSPYLIQPEFKDSLIHKFGALGMGRDDNPEKLSNGCQFYVVTNEKGLPRLDGNYVIFGQLVEGFDVLKAIESVETDSTDTPLDEIPLEVSMVSE